MFNKRGLVSISALVGSLPGAAVVAQVLSQYRSFSDVTGLLLLMLSVSSSLVAASRGSRWWLVVGGIATVWAVVVLFQMIVGASLRLIARPVDRRRTRCLLELVTRRRQTMTTSRKWATLEELLLAFRTRLVLEERPIDINEVGYDDDRPLHFAAVWGDVEAIEMLVAAGAEVDARGEFNFTPLFHAVGQGHVAAARRLLELGASPHVLGDWGGSPAELARSDGIAEMIALFDEHR
jgi:cytohesin